MRKKNNTNLEKTKMYLVPLLLLYSCALVAGGKSLGAGTGLWVWYDSMAPHEQSIFTNASALDELLDFVSAASAEDRSITTIYVQAQGYMTTTAGRLTLAALLKRVSEADASLRVGFAYGWSKHYPDASVAATTHAAVAFAAGAELLLPLAASYPPFSVIFDVEPDPAHVEQYQQLADLLTQVEAATAHFRDRVAFASTSSWAFATHNVSCAERGWVTMMECVASNVATNHLMDFRSFVTKGSPPGVDGIVPLAQPALAAALKAGTKVSLVVETNCGLGAYTAKLSFCNTSLATLRATLASAADAFAAGPFSGAIDPATPFVIEDWRGLEALVAHDAARSSAGGEVLGRGEFPRVNRARWRL